MYKLLLVDDDEIMLEGIRRNIDWEVQGIEVVGAVSNGRDGLEVFKNNIPDVVLSDIRMPFMDGLVMAEYIHNYYPTTKIVLLTGYDDFIYAKKALQLRIFEYILKYEDNDVILASVVRACKEFEEEKATLKESVKV